MDIDTMTLRVDTELSKATPFEPEPIPYTITRPYNQHPFFQTKQREKATKRISGTNFTKPKKKRK